MQSKKPNLYFLYYNLQFLILYYIIEKWSLEKSLVTCCSTLNFLFRQQFWVSAAFSIWPSKTRCIIYIRNLEDATASMVSNQNYIYIFSIYLILNKIKANWYSLVKIESFGVKHYFSLINNSAKFLVLTCFLKFYCILLHSHSIMTEECYCESSKIQITP